ncbi:MAG: class II aldolase/adducin family protein [Paracoccaceae bacterium]|jgi:L-fuculose-phosphate aldolase|nr:class II aldolase/adducin family protein [Paracoccaceae bacterium]
MTDHAAHDTRQAIVEACREMNRSGLNQGTSGNISVRDGTAEGPGLLITPSGLPYDRMGAGDIVAMGLDGQVRGGGKPSSEWRFHVDILRARPEVGAVVHAHPTACTTLAIMGRAIPPVHYMVAICGGRDIRCAPYATFGTEALSRHALAALEGRTACLLAHHGMIALGATLDQAMWRAVEVETLARQYLGCLPFGEPPELSDDEIARVLERMKGYGHAG